MNKLLTNVLLLALMATLLVACGGDEPEVESVAQEIAEMDTSTPDGTLKANILALKNNDVHSLLKSSLSSEQYSELVTEFDKNKAAGFSEQEKAQFASTMSMLTAGDAEENIMTMIGPQLEQARAMMPMMLAMGREQVLSGIRTNPMVPADQRETAVQVVGAVMDWAGENDILSEEKTREAVQQVIATAKAIDMQSLDDLQSLTFDQAMDKAGLAMGGVKNILNVYDVSLDDTLDSVEMSNVQTNGDTATMDVNMEFFGEEIKQTMKMMKKDGKWIPEE